MRVAVVAAVGVALVLAPSSAPQSGARHGCLPPGERHGFVRASDGTRIAFAEAGRGTGGIVFAHGARGHLCDFVWALRDPRLLVLAPGQGHADVFRFPRVWNAFTSFLRRELG